MIQDADIPKVVDALIDAIRHPKPRDPNMPLTDRAGNVLKVGDKVAVALGSSRNGAHLDLGQIAKLDTVNERVLIDWGKSPIRTYDVRWDKKQNKCVDCKRRKSWVWTLNTAVISG